MTLQVVDISPLGIVCAADSAISFMSNQKIVAQETWPKLLPIDRLGNIIGYYGHAQVGSTRMPDWLKSFIHHSQATTIDEFAIELRDKLNNDMPRRIGSDGTGFHLAGYESSGLKIPSFYHIWNHDGISGAYKTNDLGFRAEPDFQARDAKDFIPDKLDEFFRSRWSYVYRNGALSLYVELAESLYEFSGRLWKQGSISQPSTITEWAWYYRFQLETVKLIYRYLIRRQFPPIGRRIDVYTIDKDGNIEQLPHHP